jgi:hypothetical protein
MYLDPQLLIALDDQLRRLDSVAGEVGFWSAHPPSIGLRAWHGEAAEHNAAALAELRRGLRAASAAVDDALTATRLALARAIG